MNNTSGTRPRKANRDRNRRRRFHTAIARSQAPGCYALVLSILADRSDDYAKDVYGAQVKIAEQAGVSVRTVQRAVKWAEDHQLLSVVRHAPRRQADGTVRRPYSNTYRFCVPKAQSRRSPRHDSGVTSTAHYVSKYKPREIEQHYVRPKPYALQQTCTECDGTGWLGGDVVTRCACGKDVSRGT